MDVVILLGVLVGASIVVALFDEDGPLNNALWWVMTALVALLLIAGMLGGVALVVYAIVLNSIPLAFGGMLLSVISWAMWDTLRN